MAQIDASRRANVLIFIGRFSTHNSQAHGVSGEAKGNHLRDWRPLRKGNAGCTIHDAHLLVGGWSATSPTSGRSQTGQQQGFGDSDTTKG